MLQLDMPSKRLHRHSLFHLHSRTPARAQLYLNIRLDRSRFRRDHHLIDILRAVEEQDGVGAYG